MHSARGLLEWLASGPAIVERRGYIGEWSHRWVTGARKGWGDMGFIEGRTRFGEVTRPKIYFAILAAVLTLSAVSLLAFPAKALAAADLSIKKEGPSSSRVESGEKFDYVLTVSNAEGADAAVNVKVTDLLPGGVTLAKSEPDICGPIGGSAVTCAPFALGDGESKTITLTVTAPSDAGEITNQAKVEADGVPPENSNEVTTTVVPKLTIDKLADPDPVRVEGVLLYTLRVQNDGPGVAKGVAVTDGLPLDVVDFIDVVSGDFFCKYTAGVVQCNADHDLDPGEIVKVVIAVEPEKAGTIQNRADVFAQGVREPLGMDTVSTVVKSEGGDSPDGPDGPDGPVGPGGPDVPRGDQCSPVTDLTNGKPLGEISGTDPVEGTFKNFFNDTLPLRIAYATSSEDGSLTITVTPKNGGKPILDKTIKGKKTGVLEVDTKAGATYDVAIVPENQGFAVQPQIGSGTEPCTNPEDLNPPSVPGGDDGGNGGNDTGNDTGNGADDVIDDTISDNPLPDTGGSSLLGLAVISLGLAVFGGATVVRTGVRRRDR
jgi:uncharacterized repeat protein (TIGR01451 family)